MTEKSAICALASGLCLIGAMVFSFFNPVIMACLLVACIGSFIGFIAL